MQVNEPSKLVTQFPSYPHKQVVLVIGYCTLTDIPQCYAFVDLDGKFTENLIIWDDIYCNSSPTNQQCDVYVLDGRSHSNKSVSVNLYSFVVQSILLA